MQHMESCFAFLSCPQAVHNKRKNKMRFISYDTIVKLMEDYLPESLKNGKKKELLRQWSFCYMTWATLPRQEYHWWVCEEYFGKNG